MTRSPWTIVYKEKMSGMDTSAEVLKTPDRDVRRLTELQFCLIRSQPTGRIKILLGFIAPCCGPLDECALGAVDGGC